MDISVVTSFLKLPKKVIFLITIISTILLFSSQNFMETIALYQFKEKYTIWIGIVFLFTLGLSIINIFEYFKEWYRLREVAKIESKVIKRMNEQHLNMLKLLDEDELINIREFYIEKKNTIEMLSNDSAVAGLIKKGVIRFVSKQGWSNTYTGGNVFLFELSIDAKSYFNKFEFLNLSSIPRPNWRNGIEASHKMKQQMENLQNNLLRNL